MAVSPLGGEPVTIVALLKESDDIFYLGADSQWTDSVGTKTLRLKLHS